VDVVTQMEEMKHHYPNRVVTRFSNKALMVLDTQDDVLYLRNPGNVKIHIDGNVEIEITGGVHELLGNETLARAVDANLRIVGGYTMTDQEKAFATKLQESFKDQAQPLENTQIIMPLRTYDGSASTC
jgi:hypothetical protein